MNVVTHVASEFQSRFEAMKGEFKRTHRKICEEGDLQI